MVTGFNPDRYLHEAVRQALDDPGLGRARTRRRWGSSVFEVAAALVAVGLLPAQPAQDVVRNYERRARDPVWGGHVTPTAPASLPQRAAALARAVRPPRVVTINQEVPRPWGSMRVHYVVLGDRSTSAVISTHVSERIGNRQHHRAGSDPNGVHDLVEVADDRGGAAVLEIWSGLPHRYAARGFLSQSTSWIAFGPQRLDLPESTPTTAGRMESLPAMDSAVNHLWRRVATYFCLFPLPGPLPLIDVSIDTLIAAGALAADSPVIGQVRAVARAFTDDPIGATGLPGPWQSLLTGWMRGGGAIGAVGQGIVAPPVGNASVRVEGLVARPGAFSVYVTVSPARQVTAGPLVRLDVPPPLSWWAEDDLGSSYLGTVADGQPTDLLDQAEGSVRFWPGLNPDASELRLLITSETERAVCTLALPRWPAVAGSLGHAPVPGDSGRQPRLDG